SVSSAHSPRASDAPAFATRATAVAVVSRTSSSSRAPRGVIRDPLLPAICRADSLLPANSIFAHRLRGQDPVRDRGARLAVCPPRPHDSPRRLPLTGSERGVRRGPLLLSTEDETYACIAHDAGG